MGCGQLQFDFFRFGLGVALCDLGEFLFCFLLGFRLLSDTILIGFCLQLFEFGTQFRLPISVLIFIPGLDVIGLLCFLGALLVSNAYIILLLLFGSILLDTVAQCLTLAVFVRRLISVCGCGVLMLRRVCNIAAYLLFKPRVLSFKYEVFLKFREREPVLTH